MINAKTNKNAETKIELLSVFRNVVPADYENWLEQLALEGWNIDHVGQWSSLAMVFHRTEPKRYRYIFDIQPFPKKDYKSIYEQFGWEFVGQMSSCFIWRKEYTDERPESFTSKESIEKRNKMVVSAVSVSFTIFLVGLLSLIATFVLTFGKIRAEQLAHMVFGIVVSALTTVYLGYVMKKIYKNRFK